MNKKFTAPLIVSSLFVLSLLALSPALSVSAQLVSYNSSNEKDDSMYGGERKEKSYEGYLGEVGGKDNEMNEDAIKDRIQQEREDKMMLGEEDRDSKQENREEKLSSMCEEATARVDRKLKAFDENPTAHMMKYKNMKERLDKMASVIESYGIDVTELRVMIKTWDGMVLQYSNAYVDGMEALRMTKKYECGNSDGMFREYLTKAQEQFRVAREERARIRAYYADELRPLLLKLRAQITKEIRQSSSMEEE